MVRENKNVIFVLFQSTDHIVILFRILSLATHRRRTVNGINNARFSMHSVVSSPFAL